MLDQEYLYSLVYKEDWNAILKILLRDKNDIKTDAILKFAANIFETEFLRKAATYPIDQEGIINNLEDLFILHRGKFYTLSAENYKLLLKELGKRKPDGGYLNELNALEAGPNSKKPKFQDLNDKGFDIDENRLSSRISLNWIEIYNRLFELINEKENTATYFSGPKFINVVKEFKHYFPDYTQYIEQRTRERKSTSRKVFFYDILNEIEPLIRDKVILRIIELIRPFEKSKISEIESLLGISLKEKNPANSKDQYNGTDNPVVFISYSWDDDQHKTWVLNLADS
ncbi:MAG TPA: hypothetical protein VFE54_05685, partial [Mucilaginibacter sp.]|nr:hypothetical protein [Mucilaginibacter sp.]